MGTSDPCCSCSQRRAGSSAWATWPCRPGPGAGPHSDPNPATPSASGGSLRLVGGSLLRGLLWGGHLCGSGGLLGGRSFGRLLRGGLPRLRGVRRLHVLVGPRGELRLRELGRGLPRLLAQWRG